MPFPKGRSARFGARREDGFRAYGTKVAAVRQDRIGLVWLVRAL